MPPAPLGPDHGCIPGCGAAVDIAPIRLMWQLRRWHSHMKVSMRRLEVLRYYRASILRSLLGLRDGLLVRTPPVVIKVIGTTSLGLLDCVRSWWKGVDSATAELTEHGPRGHNRDLARAIRERQNLLRSVLVEQQVGIAIAKDTSAFGREHKKLFATIRYLEDLRLAIRVGFSWNIFVAFWVKLIGSVVAHCRECFDHRWFRSRPRRGSLRRALGWRRLRQALRADLRGVNGHLCPYQVSIRSSCPPGTLLSRQALAMCTRTSFGASCDSAVGFGVIVEAVIGSVR
ncbi:hypothetical protein KC357_g42 [Hortaea werneckii]|nr:hypothetical protein KC357_g42 [Hortaea werneckii]